MSDLCISGLIIQIELQQPRPNYGLHKHLPYKQYLSDIQHREMTSRAPIMHVSDVLKVLLYVRDADISTIDRSRALAL